MADTALMVGRTLDEYKKPRVAIGAFGNSSALCRCITELVGRNPAPFALFVLTPGEAENTDLKKICALRLAAPVRTQVRFIAASQEVSRDPQRQEINPDSSSRFLEPETVSNYARWLDQRSTRQLEEVLTVGNCLLFVQVSNASQETDAFKSLSNHCTGAVRLHDLPVQY